MRTFSSAVAVTMLVAMLLLGACTAMQTTYFRDSYQHLVDSTDAGLVPFAGTPGFTMVRDMDQASRDMYNRGYAMLGYSQFVSPLLTSLAPDYSTKYGQILGAEHVVMETPIAGESNLHAYLVTYWSKVRPEQFAFGVTAQDLPDDLLKRIGQELNLVLLPVVFPGTPAAAAGLRGDDVLLAINGVRVESHQHFTAILGEHAGEAIDVSVSRQGKQIDTEVRLATPVRIETAFDYYETPWLNTAPTDWSALSAANIAKSAREQQERMARQQELDYQRQQLAAQQYLNTLQSKRITALERSQSSRRAGNIPRGLAPNRDQVREYGNFVEHYRKLWDSPSFRASMERQQKLNIWFNHAPNIYGQLFTFSRPRAY